MTRDEFKNAYRALGYSNVTSVAEAIGMTRQGLEKAINKNAAQIPRTLELLVTGGLTQAKITQKQMQT
ncbi:MAG: DNA-binding phage protein [Oleiphilaceae bacterium]|jgi:DNA-binding phage protein